MDLTRSDPDHLDVFLMTVNQQHDACEVISHCLQDVTVGPLSQALGVDGQGPAGLGALPALYASVKETQSLSPPRDALVPEHPIRGHLKARTRSVSAVSGLQQPAAELRDQTPVRAMGAPPSVWVWVTHPLGICACRAGFCS